MGSQATQVAYQAMQSINSSTFTGSYLPIGSAFTLPSRIFKIVNDSNVAVTISTNGTTDQDFVPPSTYVLYDVCTNRGNPSPAMELPPTQFYAKGTSGTGSVYVVSLYGLNPTANQVPPL